MSEQKKKEIEGIAKSITEIGTENLEAAKNYLAGFAAGIKAARTDRKPSKPRGEDVKLLNPEDKDSEKDEGKEATV